MLVLTSGFVEGGDSLSRLLTGALHLLKRDLHEIFQARDSRDSLLDKVELLGLEIISSRFDLFLDD